METQLELTAEAVGRTTKVGGQTLMAVDGNLQEAGAIVYWSLHESLCAFDALVEFAEEAGVPVAELPRPGRAETALRRTLEAVLGGRQTLIRKNDIGQRCVVHEEIDEEELSYRVGVRCNVGKAGDKTIVVVDPEDHPEADRIREEFYRQVHALTATDISAWLIRCVKYLNGVTLRESGGFYFIPRQSLEEFRKYSALAERAVKIDIQSVPAMPADDTVRAVLSALTSEAETFSKLVQDEVLDGKLQKRALNTRVEKLAEMKKKLVAYEELLGVKLTELGKKLEDVKASVTLAVLARDAEKDDK